jgi:hypothetical protein
MKRLIALLALVFLIGCGRNSSTPANYTTVTQQQVENFLFVTNNVFVLNGFETIDDREYAIPSLEWVKKVYSPALTDWLFKNGITTQMETRGGYHDEENDCDDFADYGVTVGKLLHHHNSSKPPAAAFPMGVIHFLQDDGSGHAINFLIVTDDGKLKLIFYEPQLQDLTPFNPEEKAVLFMKL